MCLQKLIESYSDELIMPYSEELYKLLIIKVAIGLYPILEELGLGTNGPIALITETGKEAEMILQDLNGLGPFTLHTTLCPQKELAKILREAEYELLSFLHTKGEKSLTNIHYLQISSQCRYTETVAETPKIIIVAFCGAIPQEAKEFMSGKLMFQTQRQAIVFERHYQEIFIKAVIEYASRNFSALKLELRRWGEEDGYRDLVRKYSGAEVFGAAERVLELMIEEGGWSNEKREEVIICCRNALDHILEQWDIEETNMAWVDLIYREFYRYVPEIPGILDRNEVPGKAANCVGLYPMYDEKYYYLPELLFQKICTPFLSEIGLREIKNMLAELGILVGEGVQRSYHTIKIPVATEYGAILKPRCIRIIRAWLDSSAQLSWQEQIELNGEEEHYGDTDFGPYSGSASTVCAN